MSSDARLAAPDSLDDAAFATPTIAEPPTSPPKVVTSSTRYDGQTKLATGVTMQEYRRINMRSTSEGMWTGVGVGGALTYGLHRYTSLSKNMLTLTFLLSASSLSYLTSQTLLNRSLGRILYDANQAKLPQSPDGSGPLLPDTAHAHATSDVTYVKTDAEKLKDELDNLGRGGGRARARWGKGRGLAGEVEEETEMGDVYLRPGIPRRDA